MEDKNKKEILAFKALKEGNHLEAEILLREIVSSGTKKLFCLWKLGDFKWKKRKYS